MTKSVRWRMSRRGFFVITGSVAALTLGWLVGVPRGRRALADYTEGTAHALVYNTPKASPTTWFHVSPDNVITLFVQKIEMGQGILTALAQIAADELDISWERLRVEVIPPGRGLDDPIGTGNSESVVSHLLPLRNAAATLRAMILQAAAEQLGVAPATLTITDAVVSTADNRQRTFGEIVAAHQGSWDVPREAPPLKDARAFRYIGTAQARLDIPAKVAGAAVYASDVRLPNMLWGAVARPRIIGARITAVDQRDAAQLPGVKAVVVDGQFVGVAATSKSAAITALNAMQISWESPNPLVSDADITRLTTVQPGSGVIIQDEGTITTSADDVVMEFRTPMAAHAQLEPQAAVVDVRSDGVDAWVSTQALAGTQAAIAHTLGRATSDVTMHPVLLGGGFGRRLDQTLGNDAARLSQAAGQPVCVAWSRVDEFQNSYMRPPTHHVMRGRVDANGRIQTLVHHQASGDVALSALPGIAGTIMGWDIGAARGARLFYQAHIGKRTIAQRVQLPVATCYWRGLGLLADGFAIESFVDELARQRGLDPITLRLDNLPDTRFGERMRRVLRAVADAAHWGTPPVGRYHGVACSADAGTCVAQIAEVSVDAGHIVVHHVYAAVDAGMVINPTGVITQMEGGITMGVSSTLVEAVRIENGAIHAQNFDGYPLLRNSQAPDISVVIVGGEDEPGGMGEPPMGPIAAAIANAVCAATGIRLTELPLQIPR